MARTLPRVLRSTRRRIVPRAGAKYTPSVRLTGDLVHFLPEEAFRAEVDATWAREAACLRVLVPGADVQHVGSTAVPGTLTKGDLDLQVRVEPGSFAAAERALGGAYAWNTGSSHLPGIFAAFCAPVGSMDVGVQLTAIGSEVDTFWRFREVLRARPDLRHAYDNLKRGHQGGSMAVYRAAKGAFFERLRAEPEFAEARLAPG